MRIAPSRGSLCGADKWLRTWETQPFRQERREAADQTDSRTAHILEPLDDACGGICCFSNYRNSQRIVSRSVLKNKRRKCGRIVGSMARSQEWEPAIFIPPSRCPAGAAWS